MDYIGNKCPVCQKYFHADDDIVVCPECGTPHHRECYEQLGHCCHIDLHAQGYEYSDESEERSDGVRRCPSCGQENEPDSFFCRHCGAPLDGNAQRQQNAQQQRPFGAAPFGQGTQGQDAYQNGMPFLDPLGGVPGDMDLGEGVSAGEAAKYVKQNTPYFIRVFSNIKNFNKSKFNFAAAIFSGGYFLYRKMYKVGAILTALQFLLMGFDSYISLFGTRYMSASFATAYSKALSFGDVMNALSQATSTDVLLVYLPLFLEIARIAMMIVIGFCFNRMYLNHCKKQIVLIKEKAKESGENAETQLQTKGGVNIGLAVSLLVSGLLLNYLPQFIVGLM